MPIDNCSTRVIMIDPNNNNSSSSQLQVIEGLVVSENHAGNGKRELVVQTNGSESLASRAADVRRITRVLLDGTAANTNNDGTAKWFTVKKARNLIYPGIGVRVYYYSRKNTCTTSMQEDGNDNDNNKPTTVVVYAKSMDIISVNPSKQYLARLFSFSLQDLQLLFSSDTNNNNQKHVSSSESEEAANYSTANSQQQLPTNFLQACAPISSNELQKVYNFCQDERKAGRGVTLWKTPTMEHLSTRIFEYLQSDNALIRPKPKSLGLPKISPETLRAVRRLEHLYLRPSDGSMDEYIFDQMRQCYYMTNNKPTTTTTTTTTINSTVALSQEEETIHHYGDFDPCHNLPNPEDERRLKYVEERKRPQVQCMLQLVQQLLEKKKKTTTTSSNEILHAVDIGGGRGYFGIAAAGTFPKTMMHVTVVDNNEPSLEAGKMCAKAAGLDTNIEFVYCDLSDTVEVENLLRDNAFDIVFGLHCCGGLAEAAVELAIKCKADFCVSTCCFRSLPHLASLTRLAEQTRMAKNGNDDDDDDDDESVCQQYKEDVSRVATLAVTVGGTDQHCAIRAYNSMRLVAAESRVESLQPGRILQTWQESFPVEYSVQNRVLMGTILSQ